MPTDRAALIAAILEAPEDDALRLVCADWFEEQGDDANVARAQFIRTQIQRSQLPPEDLRLSVSRCDQRSRQILTSSNSLAWPVIECFEDEDVQHYRANRAPARFPPVDLALEPEFGRDWS